VVQSPGFPAKSTVEAESNWVSRIRRRDVRARPGLQLAADWAAESYKAEMLVEPSWLLGLPIDLAARQLRRGRLFKAGIAVAASGPRSPWYRGYGLRLAIDVHAVQTSRLGRSGTQGFSSRKARAQVYLTDRFEHRALSVEDRCLNVSASSPIGSCATSGVGSARENITWSRHDRRKIGYFNRDL